VRKLSIAILVVLAALPACGTTAKKPAATQGGGFHAATAGVLTVATNLPAPGFWNGDDPSAISGGFEYGIAKEMAKRLGLKNGVKVVNVSFDSLVAGQARGFDLALSQVTITPDRAKVVDFSTPYFSSDQGILVRKGTRVADAEAARRLQWGVQQSTTGQDFLLNKLKPVKEPRVYGETTQAFIALKAGQIDAVLLDTSIVLGQAAQPDSGFEVVAQFRSGEAYGALVPKGSGNLAEVNRLLAGMKQDGTLDRLVNQYLKPVLGGDPTKIPYIQIP
jgi:polar amino acid transport system substrate-binding protein